MSVPSSTSAALKTPPPPVAAESFSLSEPTLCVVQLAHQAPGVVHQVVLDPAKIKDGLIRIGEWPGDEAHGWQLIGNVGVLVKLGRAELIDGKTQVTPIADNPASA
jgi:hypothetical protein